MKQQLIKKLLFIFTLPFFMAFSLQSYGQAIFSEDFSSGTTGNVPLVGDADTDGKWVQQRETSPMSNSWAINTTTGGNTGGAASIAKSTSTNNNSCLFSPGFTLQADQDYKITFFVKFTTPNGNWNFEAGISSGTSSDDIIETFYSYKQAAMLNYTEVTAYFTPETAGTYYLSFWDRTLGGMQYMGPAYSYIDDITVAEYTPPTHCDAPTNLVLSGQSYSTAKFTWDGTAAKYNFILKDKETSEVVFTQTVNTNTISVPRSNFKGAKEYQYGVAGMCDMLASDTIWDEFTALPDTFDYRLALGSPYEGQMLDNITSVSVNIFNLSTVMVLDTFYLKFIIDDTYVHYDTTIQSLYPGGSGYKSFNITQALSVGTHKAYATISSRKDNYANNDTTATINFIIKSKNIALTKILHPTESGIYLTTDSLKVRVKNLSSHENITGVSFNVRVNETVLGQYNVYGLNIIPGDSADIKYNNMLDLSEFGDYSITAFLVKDLSDKDQSNDTAASVTITNNKPAQSFKDMFVTEISIPATPIRLTNSESISIKYVNKSGDSLDNFPIKLMVNGVVVKTDIIEERTAGLGETHEHTFTDVDLSEYKEYVLSAFTALEGDEHPENDTATTEVFENLEGSPDLPYFEDFVVEDGWITNVDNGFAYENWSLSREYDKLKNGDNTYKFGIVAPYASVERYYGSAYSSWMMSKGITLVEGEMYKIEFNLYTDTCLTCAQDQPFEKLIVNMGTKKTAAAMIDTLFVSEERLYENEVITMTFTAKETGLYYLGFHAVSPEIGYYTMNTGAAIIVVDNVSIKDSIVPIVPAPDASVTGITNPTSDIPVSGSLSNAETVTITVKNFGNIAIENVPVVINFQDENVATEYIDGPIQPDSIVSFTFNKTLDLSAIGTYKIAVFTNLENDVDNANDTSGITITILPTNVEMLEKSSSIKVYPNPVSDKLFILCEEDVKHIDIYNLEGKLIKIIDNNTKEIPVRDLKSGVYMIRVTTESLTTTSRFVKQ